MTEHADAPITDKDRQAADSIMRKMNDMRAEVPVGSNWLVSLEGSVCEAIAKAREKGHQEVFETIRMAVRTSTAIPGLWEVSPWESGRQEGLKQAANLCNDVAAALACVQPEASQMAANALNSAAIEILALPVTAEHGAAGEEQK